MNISDVRNKFPEYDDLSDDELAKGVHKKFYNDMPYSDFSAKLGINLQAGVPTMSSYNRTWGEAVKEGLSKFPDATMEMAKDTWEAVSHPIDTAEAIGNLGLGLAQKAIPGEQEKEVYADAAIDFYKDRLGSVDKIKKTLATDMPGLLGDASMVLSGGGGAISKVGKIPQLGKAGKVVTEVGNKVKGVGDFIDPVNLTAKQPVTMTAASMSPMARKMYLGGLKGTTTLDTGEKTSLFNTAIKNDIGISGKGLDKLDAMTQKVGGQIGDIYKKGAEAGDAVSRNQITDALVGLYEKAGRTASPRKNQRAVEGQWHEFEAHPENIPVDMAKDIRTDANTEIYNRSKSQQLKGYKDKALKVVSDGVKKQVYDKYPELKKLDPEYSSLKALNDVLEKSVSRIDNHNLFSLTSMMAGLGGASVNPMLALPAMVGTQIFKNPKVNSALALALVKARGGDARKMKLGPLRQGAYQADAINQIRTTKDEEGKIKKVEVE